MAPPTVTNLVPGVTGRNHPCGTLTRSTSSSDVAADVVAVPAATSRSIAGDRSLSSITSPPPFWALSP